MESEGSIAVTGKAKKAKLDENGLAKYTGGDDED